MLQGYILVVDNEPELLDLVRIHLEDAGMKVCLANSGMEALRLLDNHSFDLIVLDIMMDDLSGFEVLQRVRAQELDTPVLLLSAKQEAESKVYGFGIGADDYVTKPFSPAELVARVQAHIRRAHKNQSLPKSILLTYSPFTLDSDSQLLYKHQIPISLSDKETRLLHALMKRPKRKPRYIQTVWGLGYRFMGELSQ